MDTLNFVIDSREKRPYAIQGGVVKKLVTGDYSIDGLEEVMAVERKSFDDLFGCLTSKLTRFKGQLKRLGKLKRRAIVIDSTLSSILLGHILCKLPGELALQRLTALCTAHDVPFFFVDSHGAQFVQCLLAEWWKEEEKVEQKEAKKEKGSRSSSRGDKRQPAHSR